jgi:hypothetical protein
MNRAMVSVATLLAFAMSIPSFSQTLRMKVNIPFGFNVGEKTYQAGEYIFDVSKENVLVLENSRQKRLALFLANQLSGTSGVPLPSQVRFQCYDSRCFVSQVWISGKQNGFQPLRSRLEVELASKTPGKYLALVGTITGR